MCESSCQILLGAHKMVQAVPILYWTIPSPPKVTHPKINILEPKKWRFGQYFFQRFSGFQRLGASGETNTPLALRQEHHSFRCHWLLSGWRRLLWLENLCGIMAARWVEMVMWGALKEKQRLVVVHVNTTKIWGEPFMANWSGFPWANWGRSSLTKWPMHTVESTHFKENGHNSQRQECGSWRT